MFQIGDLPPRMQTKIIAEDGCWTWIGALNQKGYPLWHPSVKVMKQLENRSMRAHRIAYQLLKGPIPAGLQLDHVCRNRRCINPAHMEPCTNRENTVRALIAAGHYTDGRIV